MHIGILGPLVVKASDGRACELRGAKQRLLLSVLVLHAPRIASIERLIDTIWPDELPADPVAALRTQASRLRSLLAEAHGSESPLRSEPHGYGLATDRVRIDATGFREAVRRARAAGHPEAELAELGGALALWRGRAYEELHDHPAFIGEARSLEELRLGALERRIACLITVERTAEALADTERLIRADPLSEGPQALLMEALHRSGRSHDALAAFQRYRRTLADELGLDPSPRLRELEGAILRHEPLHGEAHSGITVATGRTTAPGPALEPGQTAAPIDSTRTSTPTLRQTIRFCHAPDGARLAYATVGSGPPLIKAANWLNHLEFDWESPVWRRLLREMAREHTLVRYDERGSGLSDREPPEMSLDAWVLDLEAVVEACGFERFPLLGISQGCAVCIEYAARHPERVSGLILHGGYVAGWRAAGDYPADEVARREASIQLVRHGWGADTPAYRQMFTLTFIPGGTPEEVEWFNELERRTVSPEGAARFMEAFAEIDVRHRLADLRVPTLVLHSRKDQRIHPDRGRELAAGIPGARFVELESANHLILEHEPAFEPWIDEVRAFLKELPSVVS
jgi:pimeloyl-ACP methyl ester carboxylesterase/DNA-binding SARP family transcriptional activator